MQICKSQLTFAKLSTVEFESCLQAKSQAAKSQTYKFFRAQLKLSIGKRASCTKAKWQAE